MPSLHRRGAKIAEKLVNGANTFLCHCPACFTQRPPRLCGETNLKRVWVGIVLTSGFLLAWGVLSALAGEESVGALFTDLPMGARPAGMGGAFSAIGEDANAMAWNPAGLVRVQRQELLVAHTQYVQSYKQEYLAFCLPWSERQALGFNAFFSYSDPLEKTSETGDAAGTYTTQDYYLGAAYSYSLSRAYALGITVKGIGQAIDTYRAWTAACDIGFLATEALPNLQLAAVLKNAGWPMTFLEKRHPLRWSATVGGAYALWNKRLLLTSDLEKPFFQEMEFKCGAEGALIEDVLFLRAGYCYAQSGNDLGALSGLNLGLGIRVSDYSVDYAYQPFGDLGDVHRLAVTLPFGRSLTEEQKTLEKLERQVKAKQKDIFLNLLAEGDAWLARGNGEKALQAYTRASGLNPDDAGLRQKIKNAEAKIKTLQTQELTLRAQKAYDERDYLTALVEATKALEIYPESTAAKRLADAANQKISSEKLAGENNKNKLIISQYFQQGLAYLQKSKYTQALDTWKKILALDPENSRVAQYLRITRTKMEELSSDLLKMADRHWENAQYLEAVKKWRQVLDLQPEHPQAAARLRANKTAIQDMADEYYRLGIQQYIQNNLPAAIADWQSVLVFDPGNAKALKHLEHAVDKQQELESIK